MLAATWALTLWLTDGLTTRRIDQRRLLAADFWHGVATTLRLGAIDWSTRLTLDRKLGRTATWQDSEPAIFASGITRRRLEHERILIAAQSGSLDRPEAALAELIRGEQVAGREIFEAFTNGAVANYQIEEATYLLENWDKDYPSDPLPCLVRGRIAEHRNDWDGAVSQYEAALKRDPVFGPPAYNLARVRLGQARLEDALHWYRQAAKLLEQPASAQLGIAHCLRLTGQLDAAQAELDRVLATSADDRLLAWRFVGDTSDSARASPLMEHGELALARKDTATAITAFESALSEQPTNSAIRFHLAGALRQAGRVADAEREYALVKQARDALSGLSPLLERVRSQPDNPALRTELGLLFLRYISQSQGAVWLHSALRVDPDYAPAHAALADYYSQISPQTSETQALIADHRRRSTGIPAGLALGPVPPTPPHSPVAAKSPARVSPASVSPASPPPATTPPPQRPTSPALPSAEFRFDEVAAAAGVTFTYQNGEQAGEDTIVESIGGGVGWFDFDRDHRPDLLVTGGGDFPAHGQTAARPTGLFRQTGDWRFQSVAHLARIDQPAHYTHGVAIADADGDGFSDVFITGFGGTSFYRNLGDGTFVDDSRSSGLFDPRFSTSAGWGDFNGDALPDLYVAHYVDWSWDNHPRCFGPDNVPDVCPPRQFQGLPDRLFENAGDGTFRDASRDYGLLTDGKGLGVLIADPDLDGDSDLYVANDTTENRYYINTRLSPDSKAPSAGPRFREDGLIQGVALDDRAVANGSMGVDLGDYDLDGRPDLWVANYEQELFALYHNDGDRGFQYASRQAGISELGELFVGFGTSFGDFDLDGDEDLVVANGHVIQTQRLSPIRQVPLLLENRHARFTRRSFPTDSFFGQPHLGRGLALADIDVDGDLDLAISHNNEPVALLKNVTKPLGRARPLQLTGTSSNRDAVGALVEWKVGDSRTSFQVTGGGSYLSASTYVQILVWPNRQDTRVGQLRIRWPSGTLQTLEIPLEEGQPIDLIEGREPTLR